MSVRNWSTTTTISRPANPRITSLVRGCWLTGFAFSNQAALRGGSVSSWRDRPKREVGKDRVSIPSAEGMPGGGRRQSLLRFAYCHPPPGIPRFPVSAGKEGHRPHSLAGMTVPLEPEASDQKRRLFSGIGQRHPPDFPHLQPGDFCRPLRRELGNPLQVGVHSLPMVPEEVTIVKTLGHDDWAMPRAKAPSVPGLG